MSLLCRLKNLVHKGLLKKEDLDRIVIIPKGQENEVVKMREATPEERESITKYINNMSKLTGVSFENLEELGYGLGEKPKTRRWKLVQRNKFIDICCSECGYVRVEDFAYGYTIHQLDKESIKEFFNKHPLNFCECCGSKMLPPDFESEE